MKDNSILSHSLVCCPNLMHHRKNQQDNLHKLVAKFDPNSILFHTLSVWLTQLEHSIQVKIQEEYPKFQILLDSNI